MVPGSRIRPIGADLGGGVSGLQWVVGAYTLAFASLVLSAGALGGRIGAKRLFIGGFALFTVATAGCGLAPSLGCWGSPSGCAAWPYRNSQRRCDHSRV